MELTKAEVFRRKSFLVSITNDIKSYLETTTPTPPPVSYENCFYIAETTKCLTDYIINNNDVKLAKEILEIDMSLWDKEKGYLDLDPFCKKGWEILRQIEKVEENISLLRDWYNNNSTQTAHKQDTTEPQQGNGKRGRQKKSLKDKMIDDANGEKLQKMHTILKGKKGKDVSLIIVTCIKKGWMTKPTFTEVKDEFGDIGSKSGYNKYLNDRMFTQEELEGAINSLD
ncbi:MAG: hypothetical protein J6Y78_05640 [Paludibacteraceae bacterium]|nr:hypothetical protein [Paludibacteraceae bacterium]